MWIVQLVFTSLTKLLPLLHNTHNFDEEIALVQSSDVIWGRKTLQESLCDINNPLLLTQYKNATTLQESL